MQGYIVHFFAYTMAMAGFFAVCVFIYKKLCIQSLSADKTDFLKIENGVRINARKQIFVIRAGEERFLVASDYDRTTLLAKLGKPEPKTEENAQNEEDDMTIFEQAEIDDKYLENAKILNFISDGDENIAPVLKRINKKMKA